MREDKATSWLIKNLVTAENEIMDKPGFIVTRVSDARTTIFLREVVLFEDVLTEVERKIIEKFGEKGRIALYSAGKHFGYKYSEFSFIQKFSPTRKKDFEQFFDIFIQYLSVLWYNDQEYVIDPEKRTFNFKYKNHLVCSKNGLGHILSEGCYAGFWSYLINDVNVDGIHKKCQGRGDEKCETVFGPYDSIGAKKVQMDLENMKLNHTYNSINAITPSNYKNAFLQMIRNQFFDYKYGIAKFNGHRIFIIGSNLIYALERELEKLDPDNDVLFDVCFQIGKDYMKENEELMFEFFASCGWGEPIKIKKNGKLVIANSKYPWFKTNFEHKFVIYRGLLSGMLTKLIGKKVLLKEYSSKLATNSYTVTVSE